MRHAKKRYEGINWLFIVCLLVVIGGSGYLIKTFFFTSDLRISQKPKVVLSENRRSDNYENLTKEIVASDSGELDQKIQETNYIGSALIIKDNRILVNKGYGFANFEKQQVNTPNTRFQIGSIQKSFTTTLILKAIEEGKLTLDTKLDTFYPQIQGADTITISDMLNMTSGLKVAEIPNNIITDEEIIKFVKRNTIQVNKGKYNYSPVNFILLAGILEKMYQRTYQELFNNFYHKTAGLKNFGFYETLLKQPNNSTSYKWTENNSYNQVLTISTASFAHDFGAGNVNMTTSDLYRYLHQLMNGHLISTALLRKLWMSSQQSPYHGGIYVHDNYLRLHGVKAGQQALVLFLKDMKTGVILLTNCVNAAKYKELIGSLFHDVTKLRVKF
ncbi:beta-lactamase family protein [Enterococcus faecalis]|nr:beta-lactamase family protein [Enterococcus faecalis]